MPFIIAALAALHLVLLHNHGSNNPLGIEAKTNTIPFYPYFYVKDLFGFLYYVCCFIIFSMFLSKYVRSYR